MYQRGEDEDDCLSSCGVRAELATEQNDTHTARAKRNLEPAFMVAFPRAGRDN